MVRNLLTDVAGLKVGHASDAALKSGATVVICDQPATASCSIMGGAPGTRDAALLDPEYSVSAVDAVFLSGGSAYGLDAGSGVQALLRESGRGFDVLGHRVPIVPGAIIFDLANGGKKDWGRFSPYRDLGYEAASAATRDFSIGTVGAGSGALVSGMKGGLGSASAQTKSGHVIAALAVVNAVGGATISDTGHFWAAAFEKNDEFGGLGWPSKMPTEADRISLKHFDQTTPLANTTIAVVATDANLGKTQCKRLAVTAHDGFARALWPVHTALDGDMVFSLATGANPTELDPRQWIDLCAMGSAVMARAIARAIYAAEPSPGDLFPTWQALYGDGQS